MNVVNLGTCHDDFCSVFLQLSVPDKVLIPERYVESEPEEVLSPEQEADKQRKVDRIKALIVKNRYLHHHG